MFYTDIFTESQQKLKSANKITAKTMLKVQNLLIFISKDGSFEMILRHSAGTVCVGNSAL